MEARLGGIDDLRDCKDVSKLQIQDSIISTYRRVFKSERRVVGLTC